MMLKVEPQNAVDVEQNFGLSKPGFNTLPVRLSNMFQANESSLLVVIQYLKTVRVLLIALIILIRGAKTLTILLRW